MIRVEERGIVKDMIRKEKSSDGNDRRRMHMRSKGYEPRGQERRAHEMRWIRKGEEIRRSDMRD